MLGIPLAADFSYSIQGWVSDPHDLTASLIRVIVVPQSWSFLWPGYQVSHCCSSGMLLGHTC